MPVQISNTPNPNAIKLTVGVPLGGPATYAAGTAVDDPVLAAILGLPGVQSVFTTADFVTITKSADGVWDDIVPRAVEFLEAAYGTGG